MKEVQVEGGLEQAKKRECLDYSAVAAPLINVT